MNWTWVIWGYVIGGIITFILVLVESKNEEVSGVSHANTLGILHDDAVLAVHVGRLGVATIREAVKS